MDPTATFLAQDSNLQGVPKKMFIKEMGQDRIFLNTPSFSMDKMRRI